MTNNYALITDFSREKASEMCGEWYIFDICSARGVAVLISFGNEHVTPQDAPIGQRF